VFPAAGCIAAVTEGADPAVEFTQDCSAEAPARRGGTLGVDDDNCSDCVGCELADAGEKLPRLKAVCTECKVLLRP
jgi:hypothetical protein